MPLLAAAAAAPRRRQRPSLCLRRRALRLPPIWPGQWGAPKPAETAGVCAREQNAIVWRLPVALQYWLANFECADGVRLSETIETHAHLRMPAGSSNTPTQHATHPGARPEGSGHDFFTRGEQRGNRGHRGLAVRASRQYASRMQLPAAAAASVAEHTCRQGADGRRAHTSAQHSLSRAFLRPTQRPSGASTARAACHAGACKQAQSSGGDTRQKGGHREAHGQQARRGEGCARRISRLSPAALRELLNELLADLLLNVACLFA